MAIYHLSVKLITRTTGRSATAAAAYRAGEQIHDNRTAQTFDYTRKKEVSYRRIFAPPNAPQWMKDREQLWNAAEQAESRKDAQIAREIEVALPIELSPSQQIILLERFVHTQLTSKGMVADVVIHNKKNNPHAHILLTTRDINITHDGFGQKNRAWNSKEQLEEWREQWAKHCNRRLSIASSKSRIDHRSLQDQGLDQIPTVHVGANCNAMNKRGISSKRKEFNTLIKEKNMINEKSKQLIASLKLDDEMNPIQQEIVQAKKSKHLFLNPTDFNNSKKYREAIFARTYIPILLEIFADYCTGVDEIETEIGTCFQINLNGGGKVYDYGSQIKIANGTDAEIKVAIKLAVEKGWQGLHLTGSDEFKSQVFLEAILSGAFRLEQITGYKPSKAVLEVIRDCKPALKIANESNVIKSYVVEKSDDSGTGSVEQGHLPRLKI
ncbi:MobQ family relaxase [Undibacterium oligocarboniphilum]|uniref:MobA/MobL family protein n=1 Tax=Undibacterium oligocarboniphilum TaxID=666702 RepID=A0A850QA62_9BURK|nr:MobQ family relaxase [Undibacterium oligocarboniphilum]MBC3871139.1 MobA/MobL family protein [Undibacterium oligocarboniphilum]NVO76238.1 MobA/MobL family protein [Undibacterium oligocarboniphilum]